MTDRPALPPDFAARASAGACLAAAAVLAGLKAVHLIDWPWSWVLGPVWLPVAAWAAGALGSVVVMGLIMGVAWVAGRAIERWDRRKMGEER